jgi:hypothetical protein
MPVWDSSGESRMMVVMPHVQSWSKRGEFVCVFAAGEQLMVRQEKRT